MWVTNNFSKKVLAEVDPSHWDFLSPSESSKKFRELLEFNLLQNYKSSVAHSSLRSSSSQESYTMSLLISLLWVAISALLISHSSSVSAVDSNEIYSNFSLIDINHMDNAVPSNYKIYRWNITYVHGANPDNTSNPDFIRRVIGVNGKWPLSIYISNCQSSCPYTYLL